MNLAIKGHPTRGKEVIQLLEMLGGINKYNLRGDIDEWFVLNRTKIQRSDRIFAEKGFTLEEFLEKFPYKVGDKVYYNNKVCDVIEMLWNSNLNTISYGVYDDKIKNLAIVEELKLYKEETIEEPKELIIGFTKDDNGDWILNIHKDYEIKEIEGKFKVIKKQPQYPKTYEECCEVLGILEDKGFGFINLSECENTLMSHFIQLKRCRDAYWKIAGKEMGLGKPWEPDCTDDTLKYGIRIYRNKINCNYTFERNGLLLFPTEEMQNEFYKNFRELIEECKELL